MTSAHGAFAIIAGLVGTPICRCLIVRAVAAMAAMTAVTAVATVATEVHHKHAADQSGVEDGRERENAGNYQRGYDDADHQPGHKPAWSSSRRGRGTTGGSGTRTIGVYGGIVGLYGHGLVASNCNGVLASRAWRAAMNRTTAAAAIPSPISWAVLSPNRTVGSSRRKKSPKRIAASPSR